MKLTIIPSDGAVYKDGVCYTNLSWNDTPSNIHALQWKDSSGWIEFNNGSENQIIDSLPLWANNAEAAWIVANTPVAPLPPTEEELALIAAKESALAKLMALGLTQNEIKALVG